MSKVDGRVEIEVRGFEEQRAMASLKRGTLFAIEGVKKSADVGAGDAGELCKALIEVEELCDKIFTPLKEVRREA